MPQGFHQCQRQQDASAVLFAGKRCGKIHSNSLFFWLSCSPRVPQPCCGFPLVDFLLSNSSQNHAPSRDVAERGSQDFHFETDGRPAPGCHRSLAVGNATTPVNSLALRAPFSCSPCIIFIHTITNHLSNNARHISKGGADHPDEGKDGFASKLFLTAFVGTDIEHANGKIISCTVNNTKVFIWH